MLTRPGPRAILLAVALLLAWTGSVQAQPQISGRRVALVIGNAAYTAVSALPNAGNDARLIASTLRGLGFALVGGGPQLDLDRAHLAQSIEAFGHALNGADVALFYYSGHGLQVQGVNWLVPVDANPSRPKDLDFQMVDADLVLRQMDGSGTRLNIVLLDACRNNPFAVTGLRSAQGGLAEMRAPEGTLISYATQPGNVAMDGAGSNSPYTSALATEMRQPGIDVFRMLNQVGLQVKRATAGSQQPWVSTSPIDGDFYFAPTPPVAVAIAPSAPGPSVPNPTAPSPSALPPEPPATKLIVTASIAPPSPPQPEPAPPDAAAAPTPSLTPNPTPTARTTFLPTTFADDVRAMADAQRCAILDVGQSGETQVQLRGLAVAGPSWTDLTRTIAATRGVHRVANDVALLPPFACPLLDALRPVLRATQTQTAGRMMAPQRTDIVAGGTMTVTLRGVVGDGLVFDLFRADGTVDHLRPTNVSRSGDAVVVSLAAPLKGTPGRQVLVAVAGLPPDAVGPRPAVEPANPYLGMLGRALDGNAAAQADMAAFVVQAAAVPALATPVKRAAPSSNGSHCSGIIERAQLGEPLGETDRASLRSCR